MVIKIYKFYILSRRFMLVLDFKDIIVKSSVKGLFIKFKVIVGRNNNG